MQQEDCGSDDLGFRMVDHCKWALVLSILVINTLNFVVDCRKLPILGAQSKKASARRQGSYPTRCKSITHDVHPFAMLSSCHSFLVCFVLDSCLLCAHFAFINLFYDCCLDYPVLHIVEHM